MKLLVFLIVYGYCDEMYWIDYSSDAEYTWSMLQKPEAYVYHSGGDIIKFNFGKDIKDDCGGQHGTVIRFSKIGEYCEILGHHDIVYYSPFTVLNSPALSVYYEGGTLCRDPMWGDIKRRVEFKLVCSEVESDFFLLNSLNDCTSIFEKFTQSGCPKIIQYSLWVKMIFIM